MKIFTARYNKDGRQLSQRKLYFDGEFDIEITTDIQGAVEISCENSEGVNGKEVIVTLSPDEAIAIQRSLDKIGLRDVK